MNWRRFKNFALSATCSVIFLLAATNVVLAEPRIISVYPPHLSQLDQVIRVSAQVYDIVSITNLVVDGTQVAGVVYGNEVSFEHNFQPGLHSVNLSIADAGGNTAEKTWEFYVNDPLQKYLLPDQNTCVKCHPSTWKNFPGHLVDLRFTGFHPHSCGTCHYYSTANTLIVRPDGSTMAGGCTECHSVHGGSMYPDPPHGHTAWKGTWSASDVTIKAPRESFDCQYCHQPGTKVRTGHDLVSDHTVSEPQCEACHSGALTIVHNSNGNTCALCHESTDPTVQSVAQGPMVAKAGSIYLATNTGTGKGIESSTVQEFNDLNLLSVSVAVYGPNNQVVSPEWSPGPGQEIKRIKVDEWQVADKQYVMAFVEKENKWYTYSVRDAGKVLYNRYPGDSPAREIYLPRGTTKIKTTVISGPNGSDTYRTGLAVKEAYYGKTAKCTDCHAQSIHDNAHIPSLDQSCQTCHMASLADEHIKNEKTQTKSLNCVTCHKSADPVVSLTIKNKNNRCSGCHSEAHNVLIVDDVPADIPLYSGFRWTTPMGFKTWYGEGWGPEEMLGSGKVLISDRKADVSGQAIEDFYNTSMAANEWNAGTRTEGVGYLQLQYTKGTRAAYIYWYNGSIPNTGNASTADYRLLILYN